MIVRMRWHEPTKAYEKDIIRCPKPDVPREIYELLPLVAVPNNPPAAG